jgi:hypothetical protein
VLLTRSPLEYPPKEAFPLDLHVLSTPPAFVLSQDQTLHRKQTTERPDKTRSTSKQSPESSFVNSKKPPTPTTPPPQPQRPKQRHNQDERRFQHTNQFIDKHTVEFSKIRRAPKGPHMRLSRGQPTKTYRSAPVGVKSDPARRAIRHRQARTGRPLATRSNTTHWRHPAQTGVRECRVEPRCGTGGTSGTPARTSPPGRSQGGRRPLRRRRSRPAPPLPRVRRPRCVDRRPPPR